MNRLAYSLSKRLFDVSVASAGLAALSLPMVLVAAAIRASSKGPALHWSRRVGKDNREFSMPKFRSMTTDAPQVATHLMAQSKNYVTPLGRVLRKTSIDELPQLLSILKGDMSLVGPRPALFNQDDLVALRTEKGVHRLVPGLTGWAQINGRDELPIPDKVALEVYYLENRSMALDLKIILLTVYKAILAEGVHDN